MRRVLYTLLATCVLVFVISIVLISFIYSKKKESEKNDKEKNENMNSESGLFRFLLPTTAIFSFLIGCVLVSKIITIGSETGQDKYAGIYYLVLISVIFLIFNSTIFKEENLIEMIRGKKASVMGVVMAGAIGTILFGFLDNFGMKLGTEALDDTFIQGFLGPFSKHPSFENYQKNISENLKRVNEWTSLDWRRMINQCLRPDHQVELRKNKKLAGLVNAIDKFGGDPLDIPKQILSDSEITNEYVDNIREKYDVINGSKAMLGNTFSNMLAALLGAAVLKLFTYLTASSYTPSGDDNIDKSFLMRNLEKLEPLLEGFFIVIGCLVPVFLHIAMERSGKSNIYARIVILVVSLLLLVMMYLSYRGVTNMTSSEKIASLRESIKKSIRRVDLDERNDTEREMLQLVKTLLY